MATTYDRDTGRTMSLHEYTQKRAEQQGALDAHKGLECDPQKHGAREGSAWDTWYRQGYENGAMI